MEAAARGESDQFGLFRTYAGSLRQLEKLVNHLRKKARNVRCPAMFVHSLEDTLATVKNTTDLATMISSRDKTLHLLSGCDHVLTLDLRKKDVANFVGEFVMRLAPLPAPTENSLSLTSSN
jgi:carboxylesterase